MSENVLPNAEVKSKSDWDRFFSRVPFDPEKDSAVLVVTPRDQPHPWPPRIYTVNDFGASIHHMLLMLRMVSTQPAIREIARMYQEAVIAQGVLEKEAQPRPGIIVPDMVPPNLR